MPDLLLTRAELEQLTDTVQAKRMCAWLTVRGWAFEPPARRGEIPKVARSYHDARMNGRPLADSTRRTQPNFAGLFQ
jgi:Domain of unknown function (DUF4224)